LQNVSASLQGKTLLVTGGASEVGEAIVTAFAKQPDTAVIIAGKNLEQGETLERTLCETGCNVKFIQVDVTVWTSFISLFRDALVRLKETDGQDRATDHVVSCVGVSSEAVDFAPV
jgi:NAD(P)-dependent dehydrogenase (short-subunit alcohol dehydrogenase family)